MTHRSASLRRAVVLPCVPAACVLALLIWTPSGQALGSQFAGPAALTASDGVAGSGFGDSVAVSGDTIVVGVPGAGSGGAVYVFVRSGSSWADATQTAKLTIAGGSAGDQLGGSVAIEGDTVVAGAPGARVAGMAGRGAVFTFVRPAGGWQNGTQTAELIASDGAAQDHLGGAVAISAATVMAGAAGAMIATHSGQGAAYAFTKPPGGWQNTTEAAKLTAADGKAFDALGSSIALSGSTAVANGGGAEYVFDQPQAGWSSSTQQAKLTAPAPLGAVAIDTGTIAAGATNANNGAGAVEVFLQPHSGWANTATPDGQLTASDGTSGDGLGAAVTVAAQTIAAGLTNGGNTGAAYVFAEPQTGWANQHEITKLTAPGGGSFDDFFATAIAADPTTLVAGAPFAHNTGAAYVFSQTQTTVTQPDPTAPPRYVPVSGSTPPGSLPRPPVFSARIRTADSLLLLNTHRHRVGAELLCPAHAGSRCTIHGVLWALIGHRRLTLATVASQIPAERLTVVVLHVQVPVGGPGSRPLAATLALNSSAPGVARANVKLPVIVRPLEPGKPPTVTTEQASGITPPEMSGAAVPARATLAGTVNPEGKSTRYHFELGPGAAAYDTALPATGALQGGDQLAHLVTVTASSLFAGLSYHYRLVAENASGATYGPDRAFTVPVAFPASRGVPLGDVTEAGPVSLLLNYVCLPDQPQIVTGATIHCIVTASNPQPAAVSLGQTVVAVRPAVVVLEALAAPGTIAAQTLAGNLPIPLSIPPGGTTTATADFRVMHPPVLMPFVLLQANGAPAMSTLAPAEPHVRLSAACTQGGKRRASGRALVSIACTITTTNTGRDSADFTNFELSPSRALTGPRTTAGRPPAVLPAGGSSRTTVQLNVRPGTAGATQLTVAVTVAGFDETDRLPFSVSASSKPPLAVDQKPRARGLTPAPVYAVGSCCAVRTSVS